MKKSQLRKIIREEIENQQSYSLTDIKREVQNLINAYTGKTFYPGLKTYDIDLKSKAFTKDNFLFVNIKYPVGAGATTAFGTRTMSGQERDQGSEVAMKIGRSLAKTLDKKFSLEDIDVYDMENGIVQVFAVSDEFINLK